METFEYTTLDDLLPIPVIRLNELGIDRWEMVSVIHIIPENLTGAFYRYYFKRRKDA